MNRRRSLVIITILSIFLLLLVEQSSAAVSGGVTDRLSIATGGTQANNVSRDPAFSADGRYIAFQTTATNLGSTVPGGLIYIRDRNTRQTILVSVATDGKTGAGGSSRPAISADGRFVSFSSVSPNIVLSDTNGTGDIFVRDRQLNQTYRVSVATDGTQGNGESTLSAISADGRYVVFGSNASNLVLNDTNGCWDVFIRDLQTGVTSRVSVDSGASQANSSSTNPSISANGRFIIYESTASNLVTNDTNNSKDIFVYDKDTAQTSRVSLASDNSQTSSGESSSAVISGDGRYVTFYSTAANLVANDTNGLGDIFLRDRQTSQTARISVATDGSQANNVSEDPAISTDGRFIVFRSLAANLVPDDTNNVADVFLYDQQTLPLTRISVKIGGIQSNGAAAYRPALSPDGRYIAFTSAATDLVTGDTNSKEDIFLYDRTPATTTLVAPGIGTITKDTTPTFSWSSVTGVTKYQIQVDNNSDFSSPNLNPQVSTTTYTPGTGLANGPYWWHVKVQYVSGVWGDWSDTWTFTIDTVKPPLPILLLPATKSTELTSQPTFDWSDAAEAVRYDIQVDNNSDFSSPLFTNPAIPSQYTPDPGINDGVYYWRVRSVDAAGNVSSWTAGWNIRINAVPTPTPELNTPVEGGLTNKANPVFTWLAAVGVKSYRIQVDNEVTF
ncbi:MAG: PD40 domain-containing protein, partial [Chloroflexi bacterium]|nr:PD40 domain-containing protein [Chloroflexota bacterium]